MKVSPPSAGSLNLESQLCFALYSTLHAVGKVYTDLLPDLGLTYPQYLVMLVLWEEDDIGVKGLGGRLHLDSGTLTPLLKRLQGAGLVRRVRAVDDERRVQVSLTAKGKALRAKAECVPERVGQAMGGTADDLGALRDNLLSLRAALLASRSASAEPASRRRGLPSTSDARRVRTRSKARPAIPRTAALEE